MVSTFTKAAPAISQTSATSTKALQSVAKEAGNADLSFTKTARSISSAGRAIENISRGNLLAATRNIAMFSQSAFSPTGPIGYVQSLEKVTKAEEGAAAASSEMSAASNSSLGVYGLIAAAVAVASLELLRLLDNEKKVVQVGKEQIDLIQTRVDLARQEITALQSTGVLLGDEKAKRDALIQSKRAELADDITKQKFQESEVVRNLTISLDKEKEAYAKVAQEQMSRSAQIAAYITTQGQFNAELGDSREELEKQQKAVLEAAKSADILSASTGRSKEEIFAAALAHAKQTDAAGKTTHAFADLAHALNRTTDAEGHLVSATDIATAALNANTDAVRRNISALQARGNLASAIAEAAQARIANSGLTGQAAVDAYKKEQQRKPILPLTGIIGPTTLGEADAILKQQEAANKAIDDYRNPPSGSRGHSQAGAIDSAARAMEEAIKTMAEAATKVWEAGLKRQEDILKGQLERNKVTYKDYYNQLAALQQEAIDVQLDKLHEQLNAQTDQLNKSVKPNDRTKIAVEIAKTASEIDVLEAQRTDVSRKNEEEKNKAIEQMERTHAQALISIQEESNRNLEERQRQAIQANLTTYVDAENARYAAEKIVLAKRIELVNQDLLKAKQGTEGYQKASDEQARIYEEIGATALKHNANLHDSRLKDLQDAQSYITKLASIYASVIDTNRSTAEIQLSSIKDNFLRRTEYLTKEANLEKAAEAERVRRALDDLSQQRAILELQRKMIVEMGGNPKQQVNEIKAIDSQIEAEKRESAARQIQIEEEKNRQIRQKWIQVADDLSNILVDGMKGGWKSVEQDFQNLLLQITQELLKSSILQILDPQAAAKGSSAGGIVGAVTNRILQAIGIGKSPATDPTAQAVTVNTTAVDQNNVATDQNTLAIEQLTAAMESMSAVTASAGTGSGGFWSGLLKSVIGGLVGGGFGGGSDAGGKFSVGEPTFTPDPIGAPYAAGGAVRGGWLYPVNEDGIEYFKPNSDGMIFNQSQMAGKGSTTINNIHVTAQVNSRGGYVQPLDRMALARQIADYLS